MTKKRCSRCDALTFVSGEGLCLPCHEALDGPPQPLGPAYSAELRADFRADDDARRAREGDDILPYWIDEE